MSDRSAAAAARSFYQRLPDRPDTDRAAAALREVPIGLRSAHPDRAELWAALVHSGT